MSARARELVGGLRGACGECWAVNYAETPRESPRATTTCCTPPRWSARATRHCLSHHRHASTSFWSSKVAVGDPLPSGFSNVAIPDIGPSLPSYQACTAAAAAATAVPVECVLCASLLRARRHTAAATQRPQRLLTELRPKAVPDAVATT